jgi:hypothetical protein
MTQRTSPARPAVQDHLAAERRTANSIYGVIVSSGVMASAHADSVRRLAVAVLVTLLVYWAAERYAHIMAGRIVLGPDLRWRDVPGRLREGWELVTASFVPLVVLLVVAVFGASYTTAVFAALGAGTVLLGLDGWRVGGDAGLRPVQRVFAALGAAAFGLVMIALKSLLH